MFDRFRIWIASATGRNNRTRRISRRQREESQRRLLIIGISITAIVLVLVLSGGAYYQYIYFPGQTLASVNGADISRSDYWKVRKLDLLNQESQYSQMAQFSTGQQATQYQTLAQQAQSQLATVESDAVNPQTLDQMVTDKVVLNSLNSLGLSISQSELDEYQAQQFAPAPIGSPTPTLPVDPTAAAWATATAQAQATASAQAATPSATPSASPAAGSPTATSSSAATQTPATGTPAATSNASGTPSATKSGTPSASPTAPSPTPTMSPSDARATAESNFSKFSSSILKQTGMSASDFRRLVLKPALARQKVSNKLEAQVPTRATQIHAEHILVATQDAANSLVSNELKKQSFEAVAKAKSTDSTTAPNGGDLGWIPQGIMPAEFDKVAFALKPGEVSQPFQDKYGWEIVKVVAKQDDRPITTSTLTQLRTSKVNDWLDQARQKDKITWNISQAQPVPTQQTQFTAPPDAPPTPTPLPTATPTPAPPATPGAATPGAATPTP